LTHPRNHKSLTAIEVKRDDLRFEIRVQRWIMGSRTLNYIRGEECTELGLISHMVRIVEVWNDTCDGRALKRWW